MTYAYNCSSLHILGFFAVRLRPVTVANQLDLSIVALGLLLFDIFLNFAERPSNPAFAFAFGEMNPFGKQAIPLQPPNVHVRVRNQPPSLIGRNDSVRNFNGGHNAAPCNNAEHVAAEHAETAMDLKEENRGTLIQPINQCLDRK